MNKQPLVSIVMPVYNAGNFLREAIESIFSQTYENWELVAVDDASTDESWNVLQNYASLYPKKIKIFHIAKNRGVSYTANLAISKARGRFIARMDADDVMDPERIEKQVGYLLSHPQTVVVGSQCNLINATGEAVGTKAFPVNAKAVMGMAFWACPVQQPTMMVNAGLLPKKFIWYSTKFKTGEEMEFLFKANRYGAIENLAEPLLYYRIHKGSLSTRFNQKKVFYNLFFQRVKAVVSYGYRPTVPGSIIGVAELFFVTILPERWVMPVFLALRGARPKKMAGSARQAWAKLAEVVSV